MVTTVDVQPPLNPSNVFHAAAVHPPPTPQGDMRVVVVGCQQSTPAPAVIALHGVTLRFLSEGGAHSTTTRLKRLRAARSASWRSVISIQSFAAGAFLKQIGMRHPS